jgi:hypothetical protein
VKCQNTSCFDKVILTKHLVQNDFTSNYEPWVFHGKKYTAVAAEGSGNDRAGIDRMDEMLEAIRLELNLDTEAIQLMKASEESLHEHMKVTLIAFVTRLMAIKCKFFSNNCYNELLKLFGMSFRILISYLKTCIIPRNLSKGSIWIMIRLTSAEIDVCFFGRNTRKKTNA